MHPDQLRLMYLNILRRWGSPFPPLNVSSEHRFHCKSRIKWSPASRKPFLSRGERCCVFSFWGLTGFLARS